MPNSAQKSVILMALASFGGGLTAARAQDQAETPAPPTYGTLKFEETAFDFGDVYRGIALSHRFKFVNPGPGPLTIQGVHAACGCTAAEVEKGRKYAPGESGFVDIKLDTTDFSGALAKTVTVMSNERLLPDRTLTLKATIKSEVEADPPLVDFGDVKAASGSARVIRVKPIGGTKLRVKNLTFNKDVVTAKVSETSDRGEWLVEVQLKPGLPPGFLKELLTVHNTSQHLKELPVPIRANILGNIDVSPTYLEFGAINQGDASQRSLTLRGMGPFEVTGTRVELIVNGRRVDEASRYLKTETVPSEKDKRLVAVELKNEAKIQGSVHGKLYIQTSDTAQKELAVDFYAFFR